MSKKNKISRREAFLTGLGLTLGYGISKISAGGPSVPENQGQSDLSSRSPEVDRRGALANSVSARKSHYSVVVIGSGYGASVMAARLAPKVKSLAVLERGLEWLPGDFPNTATGILKSLKSWLNPTGLIDRTSELSQLEVICANGLGGTSLLNAAISIRPEPTVFQEKQWPDEIKKAATDGSLENYFKKAEEVLKPQMTGRMNEVAKARRHQWTAAQLKRPWGELRLNINQEDLPNDLNSFGVPQKKCTLCGDCCTGCNVGAKNTLQMNYLPMAKKAGAEIFVGVEVTKIEKDPVGYLIHYTQHLPGRSSYQGTVTANRVVLGAGSKGSTEILMKSATKDFQFSKMLGKRLSANGDVMGLVYNSDQPNDVMAFGRPDEKRTTATLPGPIIGTYIDYRTGAKKVDDQFLVLDGVVPTAFKEHLAKILAQVALATKNLTADQRERAKKDLFGEPSPNGALNHSMLLFSCGHDSSGGEYYISSLGKIETKWPGVAKEEGFQRVNRELRKYAKLLGGHYIENPRSTILGEKIQATHPLGGCIMGADSLSGVVDHLGQVFDVNGGYHEGLYIVDAAIIPRSLAATPLLTISALAERIADHFPLT